MRTANKNPDLPGELLEHVATRPDRYLPTGKELDRMFDGTMAEDDAYIDILSERHCWFDYVLPSLNWFIHLSDLALEGRNPKIEAFEYGPNSYFAEQRMELSKLLMDVLMAYEPAHQNGSSYSADWLFNGHATVEMLKRYRLYTRYVESFALEVWPTLDQKLLLNPDFGWIEMSRCV